MVVMLWMRGLGLCLCRVQAVQLAAEAGGNGAANWTR